MMELEVKRPKMDTQKMPFFNASARQFAEIVEIPSFVDRSCLIKQIFSGPRQIFIAAPKKFCKSTNLSMIKAFSTIEVDANGNALQDVNQPTNDIKDLEKLDNYQLFCKPSPKCEILNDEDFVKEHFGKYPVVYLNFETSKIESFEDAVKHCKQVIHGAFKEHKYLTKSAKLDEDENLNLNAQQFCEKWCSLTDYQNHDKDDVIEDLSVLSKHLHSHFGRKVIILIDDVDNVGTSALYNLKHKEELSNVINLMTATIDSVVKTEKTQDYVIRVLLTGMSIISSGLCVSDCLSSVTMHRFLEEEVLLPFYGITETDVVKLVQKMKRENFLLKFDDSEEDEILNRIKGNFKGYYSKQGTWVYSLWTVLNFLDYGETTLYWEIPTIISYFAGFLEHPTIAIEILKLVANQSIVIEFPNKIELHHLEGLRDLRERNQPRTLPDRNIILSFMMEMGYLSNVEEIHQTSGGQEVVKLSTNIIRMDYLSIVEGPQPIAGFDLKVMKFEKCFESMFRALYMGMQFRQTLRRFYIKLVKVFKGFNSYNKHDLTEAAVQTLMFVIMRNAGCEWNRLDHSKRNRLESNLSKRSDFLRVLHTTTDYAVIWNLKLNLTACKNPRSKGCQNKTSLFALREILGEEDEPSWISELVDFGQETLIIGISIDGDLKPSISCLANCQHLKHVICVSETEPENYKNFYRECFDLLRLQRRI